MYSGLQVPYYVPKLELISSWFNPQYDTQLWKDSNLCLHLAHNSLYFNGVKLETELSLQVCAKLLCSLPNLHCNPIPGVGNSNAWWGSSTAHFFFLGVGWGGGMVASSHIICLLQNISSWATLKTLCSSSPMHGIRKETARNNVSLFSHPPKYYLSFCLKNLYLAFPRQSNCPKWLTENKIQCNNVIQCSHGFLGRCNSQHWTQRYSQFPRYWI